jgi:ATP-dependent DNA helicase DinG
LKPNNHVNIESALDVIGAAGPFAKSLNGFEVRQEQKEMMRNVLEAYQGDQVALIEAGTGTGKSLAYLIPALLWAKSTGERTVISTNTITLQEQLLQKDIPLILSTLNLSLKAVLVKGMHNYLCMRKFFETQQELLLLHSNEAEEMRKIEVWQENTKDGSRASLPFAPSSSVWEKVCAENDTCNRNACPYFQQCHFFKARREASEAQILIVNHHLLFADLVLRSDTDNFKDPAVLPPYTRIILDEAHNIEDIATDYFASRISQMDLMRLTARLAAEKKGETHGKLPLLRDKIAGHYRKEFSEEVKSILYRLNNDLPGLRRDLLHLSQELFGACFEFTQACTSSASEEQQGESKLRLLQYHHTHPLWEGKLIPYSKALCESIKKYALALVALTNDLKLLKNPALDELVKGICHEIIALSGRLMEASCAVERFASAPIPLEKVRWIELQQFKTMINTALVDADLDISKVLVEKLFNKFSTIILCSATLTTNKEFGFIRNRLGLTTEQFPDRAIREYIYDSPFDYQKQAIVAIPTDIPNPADPAFVHAAAEKIWQAVQSSQGNAFVLFTSYTMLKTCFEKLERRLKENRFHPLKQGDDDRQTLLSKFKTTNYSVLFGTDSFWEGVDVAGDALRCVIIVKLPFRVPSDPLIQARSEAISAKGGDPFMDYSLPQAIVKFKQGFGRLIRNRRDRGCIVCLDTRLITKRYGQLFLSSIPNCQQVFASGNDLQMHMKDFYRRTHFLTKAE